MIRKRTLVVMFVGYLALIGLQTAIFGLLPHKGDHSYPKCHRERVTFVDMDPYTGSWANGVSPHYFVVVNGKSYYMPYPQWSGIRIGDEVSVCGSSIR
jgi:hypothetical protein